MPKGKAMIRSLARRGARKDKSPPVAQKNIKLAEPSVCEKCGAVYARRTWRQDRRVTEALLNTAAWTVCPACRQATRGEYYGRVLIRGSYALTNEAAIRERIRKVEERARFTQPERKLVSVERDGDVLEVLTTSQKLAHRIAKELKKAFHGRATYSWSDRDGSLFATWERD